MWCVSVQGMGTACGQRQFPFLPHSLWAPKGWLQKATALWFREERSPADSHAGLLLFHFFPLQPEINLRFHAAEGTIVPTASSLGWRCITLWNISHWLTVWLTGEFLMIMKATGSEQQSGSQFRNSNCQNAAVTTVLHKPMWPSG